MAKISLNRKSYHPIVPQVKQPLIQKLCIIFCLPPTSISFFKQEPVYACLCPDVVEK